MVLPYALVQGGVVVNAVLWDGITDYSPAGFTVVLLVGLAWIGWTWDAILGFLPP